jgi:hypothetical protein
MGPGAVGWYIGASAVKCPRLFGLFTIFKYKGYTRLIHRETFLPGSAGGNACTHLSKLFILKGPSLCTSKPPIPQENAK